MKNMIMITLWCLFLSFCAFQAVDIYRHRPKKLQDDYYIVPVDIDGTYLYGVQQYPAPEGEAANLVGVDGKYVYWTTFGATHYRIDTAKKEEIRIDKIPPEVKMKPVMELYHSLD